MPSPGAYAGAGILGIVIAVAVSLFTIYYQHREREQRNDGQRNQDETRCPLCEQSLTNDNDSIKCDHCSQKYHHSCAAQHLERRNDSERACRRCYSGIEIVEREIVERNDGQRNQDETRCPLCEQSLTNDNDSIQCDHCSQKYHHSCAAQHLERRNDSERACRRCYSGIEIVEREIVERNGRQRNQDETRCPLCRQPLLNDNELIQCDYCSQMYHHSCAAQHLERRNDRERACRRCHSGIEIVEREIVERNARRRNQDETRCPLCRQSLTNGNELIQCDYCPQIYHHSCAAQHLERRNDGRIRCSSCGDVMSVY